MNIILSVSIITFVWQVATIYQACDKPDVKRALFSATLSNGIDDWARIHLDNAVKVSVGIRYKLVICIYFNLFLDGQSFKFGDLWLLISI